jgi:hypothetical protein
MKKTYLTRELLVCLLCIPILFLCFCSCSGSFTNRLKSERIVELKAPLAEGSLFEARTHNGSITINGADVNDCSIKATIVAYAPTKESAKELAEEVKIELQPSGNKLIAKIDKPEFMRNRSVGVNLDVTIPNKTDLELATHNGHIKVTNIMGNVNNESHNGTITVAQVTGVIKLKTHNGSIICKEISGNTQIRTHNGRIEVSCSKTASPVCDISLISHNGNIYFVSPPNLSAEADISTHNGKINSSLPILLKGELRKNGIKGTIGKGEGKLYIETHNGSIEVK